MQVTTIGSLFLTRITKLVTQEYDNQSESVDQAKSEESNQKMLTEEGLIT